MFRRKNKRSKWLNTLLEIEQLYNEGYLYSHISENHLWFYNSKLERKLCFYLGPVVSADCWWEVTLLNQYREHLRTVSGLKR